MGEEEERVNVRSWRYSGQEVLNSKRTVAGSRLQDGWIATLYICISARMCWGIGGGQIPEF